MTEQAGRNRDATFSRSRRSSPRDPLRTATASRATVAPILDGRAADELWIEAPVINQFRQHDPVEDAEPRYRTEARVGYGDRYPYVFVRAFDPSPDWVMALLSRGSRGGAGVASTPDRSISGVTMATCSIPGRTTRS